MIDKANEIMQAIGLPYDDQLLIGEYFKKTQNLKQKQEEYDRFLEQISPTFQMKAQKQIFMRFIIMNRTIYKSAYQINNYIQEISKNKNKKTLKRNSVFRIHQNLVNVKMFADEGSH